MAAITFVVLFYAAACYADAVATREHARLYANVRNVRQSRGRR